MGQFNDLTTIPSPKPIGPGQHIYNLVRGQIADGTLQPGERVMSTRAMATELGISRTTVTAAYEQLAAEGYLTTSAGRAARVAGPLAPSLPSKERNKRNRSAPSLSEFGQRVVNIELPDLAHIEPARYDFLYGAVSSEDFPRVAWRRAYQAVLQHQRASLYYVAPEGSAALRRALQGYLRRARGIVCDADQILVTHGSQQAIDLCARLLLNDGDAFVFENPGYRMARHCFEATGARMLPIPADEHGIDVERLPEDGSARFAYVTPSHQFPLGGVLPIGRRLTLLQWAQRHGAWIIEDDYDGEFRYGQRPIDALQAIDPDGRVIYVGTFSKALSPQLRLGYLILPHALIPAFRQAKRLTDRHAPVLEQEVLASFIDSGAYERHVRRMRRENDRRRTALLQAIMQYLPKDIRIDGTAAGLHVVLWLPSLPAQDEPVLVASARCKGVGVYPIAPLYVATSAHEQPLSAGLILGYASLNTAQIEQGIATLGSVIGKLKLQH